MMMSRRTSLLPVEYFLLLLLLVKNIFILNAVASYVVSIEPDSEECFEYMAPANSSSRMLITGTFELLNEDVDSYELSVKVASLNDGESLYESNVGIQGGDFNLKSLKSSTKFSICFQNNSPTDDIDNEFDLGFNIRFEKVPTRTLDDAVSGPDDERASALIEQASKIHQDWNILSDHFDFLRNREGIHFRMINSIMNRLSFWTYIQVFLVITMSACQVLYWKRFLEKRRYL